MIRPSEVSWSFGRSSGTDVRYQDTPGRMSLVGRLTVDQSPSGYPGSDQPARSPNRPPDDRGPRTGSISLSPPRTPCSRQVIDVSGAPVIDALVNPRAVLLPFVEL